MDEYQHRAADCPLYNQTGLDGVIGFTDLIAALPEGLRRAFEAERAILSAELTNDVSQHATSTAWTNTTALFQ